MFDTTRAPLFARRSSSIAAHIRPNAGESALELSSSSTTTMSDSHSEPPSDSDSHSDPPSESHASRTSRKVRASQLARNRIAAIVAGHSGPAPSVYTNPIQGSPGNYRYDEREETVSPISDDFDDNWLAGPAVPTLPLYIPPEMAVPLKNLRRWCALTHSAWKGEDDTVLRYTAVQEAHVVDQALARKKVCVVFFTGLSCVLTLLSFLRRLNWK